jgi:hypothetical protein
MADMHRPTRATACVEEKSLPFLVVVQEEIQVPMGEKDLPTNQIGGVS